MSEVDYHLEWNGTVWDAYDDTALCDGVFTSVGVMSNTEVVLHQWNMRDEHRIITADRALVRYCVDLALDYPNASAVVGNVLVTVIDGRVRIETSRQHIEMTYPMVHGLSLWLYAGRK